MHRNQFDNKYANFRIPEYEMERKWRVYEEEKALFEAMEARMMAEQFHLMNPGGPNDMSFNTYVVIDYVDDYFQ